MSFLSKLTERVVKLRLTHLLNSFQSAYTKYHSTESTLLSMHDHIIKAMSQQKITALCLIDLSAAFDTIDHSILTRRLSSWFGLKGTVLSWLQSYLSSRSFIVNINATLSATFLPSSRCFSRFRSRSSSFHSLHHSIQLSYLRLIGKHHLYADDSQLFISLSAPDFSPRNYNRHCLYLDVG